MADATFGVKPFPPNPTFCVRDLDKPISGVLIRNYYGRDNL